MISMRSARAVLHEAHPNTIEGGLALSSVGLLFFPFTLFLSLMTLSRLGLIHTGSIAEGIFNTFQR